MCGFAGRINFNKKTQIDRTLIKSMCDAIKHRGPDDEGFFIENNVGLGHRRLSIIDLNTGHQPMFNEDGSIVVVYNGEIYNFPELRKELLDKGHKFQSKTDTEVIIHLYEEYHESCLHKMNGMFSFALWDGQNEKLFLARDRIGIKPLLYSADDEKIVFGSELKAIIKDRSVSREIDFNSIDNYLRYGYIPSPHSIFKKVKKLLPGHYLTVQRGKLKIEQYWDIKYEYKYRSDEEDAENILSLLRSSVEMRLISDVPFGAFLSGGIDSSSVVALMSQISNMPVKTFSIGFEEDNFNELDDARFIAKTFNTEHYEEIVHPDSIKLLPDLVNFYDEPFADSSAVPTYYVSALASRHVKMILSGDGGDELFAGYLRYLPSERDRMFLRLPEYIRRNVLGTIGRIMPRSFPGRNYFRYISQGDMERYLMSAGCFSEDRRNELYSGEFSASIERQDQDYAAKVADKDIVTQYLYQDSKHYLPDDILVKVDRASMAKSIEVRVPILDYRLIEYAATIPPEKKIRKDEQKAIFKKAVRNLLPDRVFTKKKQGFGVPLEKWFRGELKDFAYENLLSKDASERGYFQMKQVRYLLDEHQSGNRDNSHYIWTLLFLELWHRQFIDTVL